MATAFFTRAGGLLNQTTYVKASVNVAGAGFGLHCAISGNTCVVGAYNETGGGAAYVYIRVDNAWQFQQRIVGGNTAAGDQFGVRVAISGDSIAVGANLEDGSGVGIDPPYDDAAASAGAVYVFTRIAGVWSQQAYIKASNTNAGDQLGFDVALEGDTLVSSAVFERSNATGINGNEADNSITGAGAVYVWTRTAGVWSQQAYVKASNTPEGAPALSYKFGFSLALSGDTLAVGQSGDYSDGIGVGGSQVKNAATASVGSAMVFTRTAGVWSQQEYIKASVVADTGDTFGSDIAISGDYLLIGASGEDSNATGINGDQTNNAAAGSGAAYLLKRTAGVWAYLAYIKASNTNTGDAFSFDLSIDGDTFISSATGEASNATGLNGNQADNSAAGAGACYSFLIVADVPAQTDYIKASNTAAGDAFGRSVSLKENTFIVGAFGEDSNATGINGDQTNNLSAGSGAAYIFQDNLPTVVALVV